LVTAFTAEDAESAEEFLLDAARVSVWLAQIALNMGAWLQPSQ